MSRAKGKCPLPEAPIRWLCEECDYVGMYETAPNPFDLSDTITGCPSCQSVDSFVAACWKCNRHGTMGCTNSTEYRYIYSCYEHRPQEGKSNG